jgi:predicted secreted protein
VLGPFTSFAVFVLLWWLVFFVSLPFGVRSQLEEGDVVKGSDPGAPVRPNLKRKALVSAVVAGILLAVIQVVLVSGIIPAPDVAFEGSAAS